MKLLTIAIAIAGVAQLGAQDHGSSGPLQWTKITTADLTQVSVTIAGGTTWGDLHVTSASGIDLTVASRGNDGEWTVKPDLSREDLERSISQLMKAMEQTQQYSLKSQELAHNDLKTCVAGWTKENKQHIKDIHDISSDLKAIQDQFKLVKASADK